MTGKRGTVEERFSTKYIPEPNSGCWIWTASIYPTGYGQMMMPTGRPERAHRVSFKIYKGRIPKKLDVMHSCDLRCCVNPDHLSIGTRKQNMEDAVRRNRTARGFALPQTKLSPEQAKDILADARVFREISADYGVTESYISVLKTRNNIHTGGRPSPLRRGEKHGLARLTNKQASKIRKLYDSGKRNQPELAWQFGVAQQVISNIVRNKTYV